MPQPHERCPGVYKQYPIMLQVHAWSCCNCMITWTAAYLYWSSLIMLQLHEGSCSNCMILPHAKTSLVNLFVYKAWWGHALHEHEQPCDRQMGITVTDWLMPRPPYVIQSASTQVLYTKIPGESISILGHFSSLTLLGARMACTQIWPDLAALMSIVCQMSHFLMHY